jgi:hypothetical protein
MGVRGVRLNFHYRDWYWYVRQKIHGALPMHAAITLCLERRCTSLIRLDESILLRLPFASSAANLPPACPSYILPRLSQLPPDLPFRLSVALSPT